MSLWITSLNSGSNGNCYYVGNEQEAVLIDAGLSCRETERRMRKLDLKLDRVKAIFISHEHNDHIKGLPVLSSRYQIPVYITPGTLLHSRMQLQQHLVFPFSGHRPVCIGGLHVTAFPKYHDAAEPHSFMVEGDNVRIGIFTDIGQVCDQLRFYFGQCHAAFLETNYDEAMLQRGRYPWHLKHRISGGKGHLSNTQALSLFLTQKPDYLSHLFLAHLSADNNDPELALELFKTQCGDTQVFVASRNGPMPVHCIRPAGDGGAPAASQQDRPAQLSLF
jgi:phosphoribosyl 1,2-cyclic phosphodiesterase